jgi:hypothetical protein
VKQKTEKQLDGVKNESLEHKWESAKLFNDLKILHTTVDSLKKENRTLEHNLLETNLKLEESYINNMVF